jgi:hypothetical protein
MAMPKVLRFSHSMPLVIALSICFIFSTIFAQRVDAALSDAPNNLSADGRDMSQVPLSASPVIHLSTKPNDDDGNGAVRPYIYVKMYNKRAKNALSEADRKIELNLIKHRNESCDYRIRASFLRQDGTWQNIGTLTGDSSCNAMEWSVPNDPSRIDKDAFIGVRNASEGQIIFATVRFALVDGNTDPEFNSSSTKRVADIRQVTSSGLTKLGFLGGKSVPISSNSSQNAIDQYGREIKYVVRFGVPGSAQCTDSSPFQRNIFWADDDFTLDPEKWANDPGGSNMRAATYNSGTGNRVGSVSGLRSSDVGENGFAGADYNRIGRMPTTLRPGENYVLEYYSGSFESRNPGVNRGNMIAVEYPYDSAEYYIDDECPPPEPVGGGACDLIGFNVGNNGNSTTGDRRYKVWVNDFGSPGTPSGGEDFNGLAREDGGPAGYTLDNANARINLREQNKIVSGNLQFTIRVHDTSSSTSPVIFEQTYNVGPCYVAECQITVHNTLPAASAVKAGQQFNVGVKLINRGINAIPQTLNTNSGNYVQGGTLYLDGVWSPNPDGDSYGGLAPIRMPHSIYPSNPDYNPERHASEVSRTITINAPNDRNSRTMRIYPDLVGRGPVGQICNGTVNTYQRYDFSATAGTQLRPDSESPSEVRFITTMSQNSGSVDVNSKITRNFYKNDNGIAGFNGSDLPNPRNGNFGNASYTDNYPVVPGTYTVGDRFCTRITLDHGHGWRGPGEDYQENSPETATDCTSPPTVTNHPYIRAYGSDVVAGGGFGTSCSRSDSRILTFMRPIGEQNPTNDRSGSGVQLAAMALGEIRGFTSASIRGNAPTLPAGLTFANNISPSGNPLSPRLGGGVEGDGWCMKDYFTSTQYPDSNTDKKERINTGTVDIANLANDKQTFVTPTGSTVTINNSAANYTGRRTVYIDGDAFVNSNIRYNTNYPSVDDIPSFTLVVKGNIYISNNVTQVDGLYIAQPRDNTKGRIYTCANSSGPILSPSGLWNDCGASNSSRQLIINGTFLAERVVLNRTAFTLRDSRHKECVPNLVAGCPNSKAAEVFNFSPELYLSPPLFSPRSTAASGDYQYFSILPPVL